MSRIEKARVAQALRDQGFTAKEIGAALGISRSYAAALCSDPDGSKDRARKASYGGTCEVCGAPTCGSEGRALAPKTCRDCAAKRMHDDRYWTQKRIIESLHAFVREHGRKPMSGEWLHGSHGQTGDGYPYTSVVQREFGSWNAALKAAGLPIEGPGKYERTETSRARLSEGQRRRWGLREKYGELVVLSNTWVGADQLAALAELNGCSRAEHVRRALALYLEGQNAQQKQPEKRRWWSLRAA